MSDKPRLYKAMSHTQADRKANVHSKNTNDPGNNKWNIRTSYTTDVFVENNNKTAAKCIKNI